MAHKQFRAGGQRGDLMAEIRRMKGMPAPRSKFKCGIGLRTVKPRPADALISARPGLISEREAVQTRRRF